MPLTSDSDLYHMSHGIAAVPFYLSRTEDSIGLIDITQTTERIHGLLRLQDEELVVQWRLQRKIERVGTTTDTNRALEPVREVRIPLSAIAGALVRRRAWYWLFGPRLVLMAPDLAAFETLTGAAGLALDHPATLTLKIPRSNLLQAREFAAELNLEVAERMIGAAESKGRLPGDSRKRLEDGTEPP